jgi:hypothetical protein
MAQLRTHQFYQGIVTSTTKQDLYTVPTGKTIIVKSVVLRNHWSSANQCKLFVRRSGSDFGWYTFSVAAAPASHEDEMWVVFVEGDLLWATVANVAGADFILSGSLLYI